MCPGIGGSCPFLTPQATSGETIILPCSIPQCLCPETQKWLLSCPQPDKDKSLGCQNDSDRVQGSGQVVLLLPAAL